MRIERNYVIAYNVECRFRLARQPVSLNSTLVGHVGL